MNILADIYEALEDLKLYTPVYLAILKKTGDKQQALEAIKFLKKVSDESQMPELRKDSH